MEKRRMRKLLFTLALFCAILFGSLLEASAQTIPTLLNEIVINPPGTDNPCEYIEIRGMPGATLTNTYVVAIEGDISSTPGVADLVVDLNGRTIGSNGILIITGATTCPGRTIAAGATQVTDTQLDTGASGIENGTITFLLVTSPTPIVEGTDYDANNDGTLEALPAGAVVLDAIGVADDDFGDIVYYGQVVTQNNNLPPQAITRFTSNNNPVSSGAWYGGAIDTAAGSGSNVYSTTNRTSNFPTGGALTPGAPNVGTFVPKDVPVDFNGDGRSEFVVVRSSGSQAQSTWLSAIGTSPGTAILSFGLGVGIGGDVPVPEDYDGDGRDDAAVWRVLPNDANRGYFHINRSSGGSVQTEQFGTLNDNPTVVGDYDGDNKADLAVYRRTTSAAPLPCGPNAGVWFYRPSATPAISFRYICWGAAGDIPVPGDYDGDDRMDAAVYRPSTGTFFIAKSAGGTEAVPFGATGDIPVPGDYDGDGRFDYAVARQGTQWTFFIRLQAGGFQTYQFGAPTDLLVPGDYTGDGKFDIAVWRPSTGTFYVRPVQTLGTADFAFKWGQQGDYPVANFRVTPVATAVQ
jgi:hypothetical protein